MLSVSNLAVVLLSVLVASFVSAVDFSCPKNRISPSDGTSGALPAGATDVVQVPQMTNCTVMFEIPKGYALKMETTATYDASAGDFVWFDSFYITSPANKEVEFTVKTEIEVKIVSVKGFPYFGKYTYVDLRAFSQVLKPTGTFFNATLEPNKYYTFRAADNDQVVFSTASRNTGFHDQTMHGIFVFDGNDVLNSDYMGRVSELSKIYDPSESNTMTFLNLYQEPSNTLILGNDWSKIREMDQYGTNVIDPSTPTTGYMYNVHGRPHAFYTFICDDCSSFYIESIEFENQNDASGYLEVQGMTPTHGLQPVLRYNFSLFTNMSLPQLIPAPMATFHAFKAGLKYVIRTDIQNEWLATSLDHSRSVFSPQLWNPDADQQFDYTFSDPLQVYNFFISLDSIRLIYDGDELDVQVGSVNGLTTLDKKYTKTSMARVPIYGMGRYLHLKYTGGKTSEVKLSFKMLGHMNQTTSGTVQPAGTTGTTGTGATQTSTQKSVTTSTIPTVSSSTARSTSKQTTPPSLGITSTVQTTTSDAVSKSSLFSTGLLILLCTKLF